MWGGCKGERKKRVTEENGDQRTKRKKERMRWGGWEWRLCHTLTALQAQFSGISALIHELSFPQLPMAISFQFLRLSFRLQRVFWLMHCFNESAPLANIFDCMKGHNRKLNRLKVREFNGSGAVRSQDSFFEQNDWLGRRVKGGRWGSHSLVSQAAKTSLFHATQPFYPSIQNALQTSELMCYFSLLQLRSICHL